MASLETRKHLIYQPSLLADLLLTIPLIKRIHTLWPEDDLHLVCDKGSGDFFLRTYLVDEVYEIDRSSDAKTKKTLTELMQNEYEYLICPDTSLDVSLITRKIKAKNRISFETKWNSLFYSSRVKKPPQYHEALRLISLLGPVDMNLSIDFDSYSSGDQVAVPEWASMSLRPHFDSKKEVLIDLKKQFSIDPRKYAIFAPGIERETKKWLPDGFRIVMEQIAKKGFQVLILGTFSEKEFCDKLASEIPNAMSLAGKVSLYQMTHLMTDAEFVLCNDSAAMHLASIADTPTISLFGPTTAQKGFGPWQNRALVVEKGELACRPCKRLDHRACPLGTHDCMKLITPEEVLAAIKDLTQDPNTLSH